MLYFCCHYVDYHSAESTAFLIPLFMLGLMFTPCTPGVTQTFYFVQNSLQAFVCLFCRSYPFCPPHPICACIYMSRTSIYPNYQTGTALRIQVFLDLHRLCPKKTNISWKYSKPKLNLIQAYVRDIVSLVPHHCNKVSANNAGHMTFLISSAYKVMFILYCSVLSVH